MRIAIVGAGISGLLTTYLLHREHEITVYEANDYPGGHTHTVDVTVDNQSYAVDTGFIVYNDWMYPNFIKLLDQLGVANQPTTMSFSVSSEKTGLEYNGTSFNSLFAQRRNLLRPSFYRMIRDIVRFNRESLELLKESEGPTLGEYLQQNRYSAQFIENYITPMGAAVWSAPLGQMAAFPARSFVEFFNNHGMLNVNNRPQWRSIKGGSREYVKKLTSSFAKSIRLNSPVTAVQRAADGVTVTSCGKKEYFDRVILACHSDQALAMLADPSVAEREILGSIPYQYNETVLHTDQALLPRNKRAWASWNYRLPRTDSANVTVTYNMNMLQTIQAPVEFCVTLNQTDEIDPAKILRRINYHHPVYTHATVRAQKRRAEISNVNRTHYCGAYWEYGFHEDGVRSALAVCRDFGVAL